MASFSSALDAFEEQGRKQTPRTQVRTYGKVQKTQQRKQTKLIKREGKVRLVTSPGSLDNSSSSYSPANKLQILMLLIARKVLFRNAHTTNLSLTRPDPHTMSSMWLTSAIHWSEPRNSARDTHEAHGEWMQLEQRDTSRKHVPYSIYTFLIWQ